MAAWERRTLSCLIGLVAVLASMGISGCLTLPRAYSFTDSLSITITPAGSGVPYTVWLPVLFLDNVSNQEFEPLGVAPPSENLTATSGVATLSFETNETYWRFLRVDATGPVVLSSTQSGSSPDISQTEAHGSYPWTAGRDEDIGRGSTRADEILVGVQVHAQTPFDIQVTVDRAARSDFCNLRAGFNGSVAPPSGDVAHWQWLAGNSSTVCT